MIETKLETWCKEHRVLFCTILIFMGILVGLFQALLLKAPVKSGFYFGCLYAAGFFFTEMSYEYN